MYEWQHVEGDESSYPMWYLEFEGDEFEIVDFGINIMIFVNGGESERDIDTIEEAKEIVESMIKEGSYSIHDYMNNLIGKKIKTLNTEGIAISYDGLGMIRLNTGDFINNQDIIEVI